MKSLLLSGYNIHLQVKENKLIVMDGLGWNKEPTKMIFNLNMMSYDNIIIYGHSGNVSLSAINWLMKHNVSINIMNNDGSFLTSINPPQLKFGHIKMAQYKAHQNNRIGIGKKFIEARIKGIESIMKWLNGRYSGIHPYLMKMDFQKIYKDLDRANNDRGILKIESGISDRYRAALKEIFSEKFDIDAKGSEKVNLPGDPADLLMSLFDYGYAVLESICLRAVNGANLDPYIGFIHRMKLSRSPFVEDLKEPFQWLVDRTIIQALENDLYHYYDFERNEDQTFQLKPAGLGRLINDLDRTFSQTVKYKGRRHQWYVLVQIKTQEFSQYLVNNRKDLDFTTPEPHIEDLDRKELRERILKIPEKDWLAKGYSKSSLNYLKHIARSNKPLNLSKQSAEKVDSMNSK